MQFSENRWKIECLDPEKDYNTHISTWKYFFFNLTIL